MSRLGDQLVMAMIQTTSEGQATVPIRVVEPSGVVAGGFVVVPEAVNGVATAGESSRKRLLLALTRETALPGESAIQVIRHGCL